MWRPGLDLLDLLVPEVCAGCGEPGRALCAPCLAQLPRTPVRADAGSPDLAPGVAAGAYRGVLRSALVAYKEHGRAPLGRPLAELLAGAITAAAQARQLAGVPQRPVLPGGPLMLVPAPSRPGSRRHRGVQPLPALTRLAAAGLRRHGQQVCVLPALQHVRRVKDQTGLGARARAHNLRGSLGVSRTAAPLLRQAAADGQVLVVDDVLTTGATVAECFRALAAAGIPVHASAVLALAHGDDHAQPLA